MKIITIGILVASFLMLAGCGGDPALSRAHGKVKATDLPIVHTQITSFLSKMKIPATGGDLPNPVGFGAGPQRVATVSGVGPSAIEGRVSAPYDSCTTVTGVARDADGDGVDVERAYRFNCRNVAGGYSLIGTQVYKDLDDSRALPEGGYSLEFDFDFIEGPAPRVGVNKHRGFFKYQKQGSSYKHDSRYKLTVNDRGGALGEIEVSYESNWSTKITPGDTSNTYGELELSGFWGITGFSSYPGGFSPLDVAFSVESNGLEYLNTCANFYSNGTITLTDGSRNQFEIDFTGCTLSFRFNGVVFTP